MSLAGDNNSAVSALAAEQTRAGQRRQEAGQLASEGGDSN